MYASAGRRCRVPYRCAPGDRDRKEPVMVLHEQEQQLVRRWIEPHPWKEDPAEARLKEHRISVWALIGALRMYDGDLVQVAAGYHIPLEAMQAALAYYHQHQCAIDARLDANAT